MTDQKNQEPAPITQVKHVIAVPRESYDDLMNMVNACGVGYVTDKFGKRDEVIMENGKLIEKSSKREILCIDSLNDCTNLYKSNYCQLVEKYGPPITNGKVNLFNNGNGFYVHNPKTDQYIEINK